MHMWINLVASNDTLVDICEKAYLDIFKLIVM